jgi:hypothetical protein
MLYIFVKLGAKAANLYRLQANSSNYRILSFIYQSCTKITQLFEYNVFALFTEVALLNLAVFSILQLTTFAAYQWTQIFSVIAAFLTINFIVWYVYKAYKTSVN